MEAEGRCADVADDEGGFENDGGEGGTIGSYGSDADIAEGAVRMPSRGRLRLRRVRAVGRPRAVQLRRATARATGARAAREGHREGRRRRPL
jgi:hypothetical protein